MIELSRWQTFTKRDQIAHIGADLYRAATIQRKDIATAKVMLERAMNLIDLSLEDPKWRGDALLLLKLRGKIASVYIGHTNDIESIYALL